MKLEWSQLPNGDVAIDQECLRHILEHRGRHLEIADPFLFDISDTGSIFQSLNKLRWHNFQEFSKKGVEICVVDRQTIGYGVITLHQ